VSLSGTQRRGDFPAQVTLNRPMGSCYYRLSLAFAGTGAAVMAGFVPGQFVEIDLSEVSLPAPDRIPGHLRDASVRQCILRRPFSICAIRSDAGQTVIDIIYAAIGPATLRMTTLRPGDVTAVLGPLGNGFQIPAEQITALLVAGGVGAPPIQHLATVLAERAANDRIILFTGARTLQDLPYDWTEHNGQVILTDLASYPQIEIHLATDDGSYGYRGLVTDCLLRWLNQHHEVALPSCVLYACGPEPMLAAAAAVAADSDMACQVSLERRMACGINLCQGCAVETVPGDRGDTVFRMCCQDGPVFDARSVIFG